MLAPFAMRKFPRTFVLYPCQEFRTVEVKWVEVRAQGAFCSLLSLWTVIGSGS